MNKIITISRQYGSGGREIGQKLAKHYDIPFYDNEIITRAAKESGFAEETFARAEDKATNSLLYSLAMGINVYETRILVSVVCRLMTGFSLHSLMLSEKLRRRDRAL